VNEATRKRLEALVQRDAIAPEDIDDVIGIAEALQEEQRRAEDGASVADVKAVAGELDIAPEYVEQALAELHRRREVADQDALKAELQAADQARTTRLIALTAAGVLGVLLIGQGVAVQSTASKLRAASANVEHTAEYAQVVFDRQASLVPQLVALSGGDPGALRAEVEALQSAPDLDSRIAASRKLDMALATALAALPQPRDETEAVQRLGLTHEVTGVQNRRATELRRLEDAQREWTDAREGTGASIALALGLAEAPQI
jgi:hypothetical protein